MYLSLIHIQMCIRDSVCPEPSRPLSCWAYMYAQSRERASLHSRCFFSLGTRFKHEAVRSLSPILFLVLFNICVLLACCYSCGFLLVFWLLTLVLLCIHVVNKFVCCCLVFKKCCRFLCLFVFLWYQFVLWFIFIYLRVSQLFITVLLCGTCFIGVMLLMSGN